MNLKEIREAMYAQADWSPKQSPSAEARVNGFINRAYNQISLEAPYLFFADTARLGVEADVMSQSDSDLLELDGNNDLAVSQRDPWTFTTAYTKTTADAAPTTYTTTWKTDRSWDGREIQIELPDGTTLRNVIRTVWYAAADDTWKLTVVHPWNWAERGTGAQAAFAMKWRIFTESYPFPDDIIQMRSMRLFNNSEQYPLDIMGQDEAEVRTLIGPRAQVASGIPRVAVRREHFQLEGPAVAPKVQRARDHVISAGQDVTVTYPWKGPEKPGEFEYVVTYTWGKRDAEFRLAGLAKWDSYAGQWRNTGQTIAVAPNNEIANNRIREPRYESAPSPVSASIKTQLWSESAPEYGLVANKITVPNIEYALGFLTEHPSGSPSGARVSQHQSGIHVRVYRRRKSVLPEVADDPYSGMASAAKGLVRGVVDIQEQFLLLFETRVDEINQGVVIDDGQYIPDRSRPLRAIHGYQQYALYPHPDARYEIDAEFVRAPAKLEGATDVPRIQPVAVNALITRAMVYLFDSMGNGRESMRMEQRYTELLAINNKRFGEMRPPAVPVQRRMTRARYGVGAQNYRKWW